MKLVAASTRTASLPLEEGRPAVPRRPHRYLKTGKYASRIGSGAPVYLAAVLEYLTDEILELTGNAFPDNKKSCIITRHVQFVDEGLNKLLAAGVTIADGSVGKLGHGAWRYQRLPAHIEVPEEAHVVMVAAGNARPVASASEGEVPCVADAKFDRDLGKPSCEFPRQPSCTTVDIKGNRRRRPSSLPVFDVKFQAHYPARLSASEAQAQAMEPEPIPRLHI